MSTSVNFAITFYFLHLFALIPVLIFRALKYPGLNKRHLFTYWHLFALIFTYLMKSRFTDGQLELAELIPSER